MRVVRDCVRPMVAVGLLLCSGASFGSDVWYVDDDARPGGDGRSWDRAFGDLQSALSAARVGDDIWVAEGFYVPSLPPGRDATFAITPGIRVFGGFEGNENALEQRGDPLDRPTELSGQLGAGQRAYSVVTFVGTDSSTTLDGFVIADGDADGIGTGPQSGGGGIYIQEGAATLRNLRVENNRANRSGGGIGFAVFFPDTSQLTIIEDCVFESNSAGTIGGAIYYSSPVEIRRCTFDGNTASSVGGAVYDSSTGLSVVTDSVFRFNRVIGGDIVPNDRAGAYFVTRTDSTQRVIWDSCVFIRNEAPEDGAVAIEGFGTYEFLSCAFYGNLSTLSDVVAEDGAGAINFRARSSTFGGTVTVSNSLFSGNFAERALGTIVNDRINGVLLVANSTLSRNTVDTGPTGGIYADRGQTSIISSILWENTSEDADTQQQNLDGDGFQSVDGSIIGNLFDGPATFPGSGNADTDPVFVDPDGVNNIVGDLDDNVQLMPGSPAIDAGNNLAVDPRVGVDVYGNPRFVDDAGTPDTGVPDGVLAQVDIGAAEFQGTTPEPCAADLTGDFRLDFFDVQLFLQLFAAQDPASDFTSDGTFDFFDVQEFLSLFSAGCP